MIKLTSCQVVRLANGQFMKAAAYPGNKELARQRSLAWQILEAHNVSGNMDKLRLKFDGLLSPDDNYASIFLTLRAVGMDKFPIPWVITNCHNTLATVGGTINNDDHAFGLGNMQRYGGIFVPPYMAVIHQYIREQLAASGQMLLGSDSHTRYGALGCMGIGEGGAEIAKQELGQVYELTRPEIICINLTGRVNPGVGPMDVALALIGQTFKNGFNKNKILEFVGPGIADLSMEYRMYLDVMTTESAALSSIWETDATVAEWYQDHGRAWAYKKLTVSEDTLYDGLIEIDLSTIRPQIALPFHPSNVYDLEKLTENESYLKDVLREIEKDALSRSGLAYNLVAKVKQGKLMVDQASVAGCAGGSLENISVVADILDGYNIAGNQCGLGVFPASQPILLDLIEKGIMSRLVRSGVTLRPCICGPCFGACDIPANGQLAIRHVARNYYTREGSKPKQGQLAGSALMDARSIAATIRNGGALIAATQLTNVHYQAVKHHFDASIYQRSVYNGFGKPEAKTVIPQGPNIADWPELPSMKEHVLVEVTGLYHDSVTTDELCPSGDATAYRSNPEKIASYTLISKDSAYLERAKIVREAERLEIAGKMPTDLQAVCQQAGVAYQDVSYGSAIIADELGDGSSREQAVSNQKVLGGLVNMAGVYANKRYFSNCINWGILPLLKPEGVEFTLGDKLFFYHVRSSVLAGKEYIEMLHCRTGKKYQLYLGTLTKEEVATLVSGSMINYYKKSV